MARSLPLIRVQGTHYEVGFQTGTQCRDRIQMSVDSRKVLRNDLQSFYQTEHGRKMVDKLLDTSLSVYPQYVDEIRGMAEGAYVDFIELFLFHIVTELSPYLKDTKLRADGCSDLFLMGDSQHLMVHSEDADVELVNLGYFMEATIISQDGAEVEERLTCFSHPGMLVGTAFGFNQHGMCSSMNIVFQEDGFMEGISRRFVARALLTAKTVEEAVTISEKSPGIAIGINYNFAWVTSDGVYNMASLAIGGTSTGTKYRITPASNGFSYTFNDYKNPPADIRGIPEISSGGREKRMKEILQNGDPKTKQDLLEIISDTGNKEFPFYRNGNAPDVLATAAVGVFDLDRRLLEIYNDKPTENTPLYKYTMPFLRQEP